MKISSLILVGLLGPATLMPAAPIAGGDSIKLDFSTSGDGNGGSLADWNQVHGNLNETGISAGSVTLHGGGTVDGVAISFTNLQTGSFNNDGDAAGWGGTAGDPYYILAVDDIYYHNVAADFGVTFSGLNDSLSYNLRSYTLIGDSGSTVYDYSVSDDGGTQDYSGTNTSRWNASTLEAGGTVFSDLQTDGSGNITVTYSSPNAFALNAIVLEVIDDGSDTTAPTIVLPTNPADDTSGVLVSSDLVATFSEGIALTGSGTVTIRDLGPGADVVIDLSGADPDGSVSVSGSELTISPSSDLVPGNDYAIQISADAVEDLATAPNAFAGILDDTTWSFQTAAASNPIVAGRKIGLAPGTTLTDDAGNDWFDFVGTGTYNTIHDLDGLTVDGLSVTVAGSLGFNTAGENNWVGLSTNGGAAPAEFVDSVTTDLLYNDATITITGLDTELRYDIYTVSHGGGAGHDADEDTHTITGDVSYGSSTHTRGDARLNGTFHTFLDVTADSSGQIVLVTSQPSGSNAAFNGLLLEAKVGLDGDDDGLLDSWELAYFGDLDEVGSGDPDLDGLDNAGELLANSDPTDDDTDDDGLLDGAEVNTHGTDPLLVDTDGDTLSDFDEVNTHPTDPLNSDSDGDELTDGDEFARGTNPILADSDTDGAEDGLEVLYGFDPDNDTSTPTSGEVLGGLVDPGSVGKFIDGGVPAVTPVFNIGNSWARETALPNLSFSSATGLVPEPRSNNVVVVEREGRLQQADYDDSTSAKTEILDLTSQVVATGLGGLMTVVFHPDYNLGSSPNKDYVYAFYTTTATAGNGFTENADGSLFIRVSRFTRDDNTGLIPISSEQVLIQQHFSAVGYNGFVHIAGGMAFGGDGFLYIGWGDNEHAPNDVIPGVPFYQDAQRVDRVFQCALIAIDVDSQGGAVSSVPTRALQGATGPNGITGATQSCPPGHLWYHADNHSGVGYYIPKTNYFHKDNNVPAAGTAGTSQGYLYTQHEVSGNRSLVSYNYDAHGPALEEHVALGLRNAWKLAADPMDGDIAMFEVGSNSTDDSRNFEEFNVMEQGAQGGNYGWPYRESNVLQDFETGVTKGPGGDSGVPVYLGVETDPVFAYSHAVSPGGKSASGGLFYYGTHLSTLNGTLIGGDHDGDIWSVDYKSGGAPVVTHLLDSGVNIRQMTASPDGEDILWVNANKIYRLVDVSESTPEPPATLSATGAFASLATLEPRDGMISFDPIAPLWSDRATKYRYIAVPNDMGVDGEYDHADEKIGFSENGPWSYPEGTVLVKHFSLPLDEGDPDNPATLFKLETRFFVHGDDGEYYGFTYKWRDDQTDADLVPPGDTSAYQKDLTVTRSDNTTYVQTWDFPTRNQCFDCHQPVTGFVLGPRSRQLNKDWDYSTTTGSSSNASAAAPANQLMTLDQLEIFDRDLSVSETIDYLTSANIEDETATLEHRVMSYLDSNCASCHQPNGDSGRADFDALLTTPLYDPSKRLVGYSPQAESFGLIDALIVKPGDPMNSLLYHRDSSVDSAIMMPPLAKTIEHDQYLEVLYKWIERIGYANFDAHATSTGLIGGLQDDDDGDQLVNGLEFYLGTDPNLWTGDTGVSIQGAGGVIQYQIPVNGDAVADGITPTIQDSVNLVDWFEAGTFDSILSFDSDTSGAGVSGTQVWEVLPGHDKGFFRLSLPD